MKKTLILLIGLLYALGSFSQSNANASTEVNGTEETEETSGTSTNESDEEIHLDDPCEDAITNLGEAFQNAFETAAYIRGREDAENKGKETFNKAVDFGIAAQQCVAQELKKNASSSHNCTAKKTTGWATKPNRIKRNKNN